MPDRRQKPSFRETVPRIITAIAALIGSVAALITALYGAKLKRNSRVIHQRSSGKRPWN